MMANIMNIAAMIVNVRSMLKSDSHICFSGDHQAFPELYLSYKWFMDYEA